MAESRSSMFTGRRKSASKPAVKRVQAPVAAMLVSVIDRAITEVRAKGTPVYTFAFYHDHESAAVSVCVDTKENSAAFIEGADANANREFRDNVRAGDLKMAALWRAAGGRSFSLGDFAVVNVARTDLPADEVDDSFYLAMIQCVMAMESDIAALAPDPSELRFCCSSADDEVGFVWST